MHVAADWIFFLFNVNRGSSTGKVSISSHDSSLSAAGNTAASLQPDAPWAASLSQPRRWALPVLRIVCSSPSHPTWSSAPLRHFSSLVKYHRLFPCSEEHTTYVIKLPAGHENQHVFCCEGVGWMSNTSRFPWLLYLHEWHPQERGSLDGGLGEMSVCRVVLLAWSAIAFTSQHLSHSIIVPNRDISPLLGWASASAYNYAAASAESDQPELRTMSLTSATHSALRLHASAQEKTCWKLQRS